MAIIRARDKQKVEELLETIKRLPPRQLHEFEQQFAAWRAHDGNLDAHFLQGADEKALLRCIEENSKLPAPEQRRFNRLRHKHRAETLTDAELQELQGYWQRVEQMNVKRLEALAELARRRGTDVRTLMGQLHLSEPRNAF
jgi:hypothetical protein